MPIYCNRPFDTLLIDDNADCFVCECPDWLPTIVGNCHNDDIDKILKNPLIKEIQQTIIRQTYSKCDLSNCMIYHTLKQTNNMPHSQIKSLVINIDRSCNLACPSCRVGQFMHKNPDVIKEKIHLSDKILKFVNSQQKLDLRIGGDGDIFASRVYRYFLERIENNNHRINLQTNGLLISKSFNMLEKIFPMWNAIRISYDANSEKTYKKVRYPGNWNQLQKNVDWLFHHFPTITKEADFVVQQKNYHEILDFIKDKSLTFDLINLQKIADWSTYNNFNAQAVWMSDHPEYENFVDVITQANEFPKVRMNNLAPYVDKTA